MENARKQKLQVIDKHRMGIYEIEFTDLEFNSNKTICKKVTSIEGKQQKNNISTFLIDYLLII